MFLFKKDPAKYGTQYHSAVKKIIAEHRSTPIDEVISMAMREAESIPGEVLRDADVDESKATAFLLPMVEDVKNFGILKWSS